MRDENLPADGDNAPFKVVYDPSAETLEVTVAIPESGIGFREVKEAIEKELIIRAMQKSAGNRAKAARWLKMNRTTLLERMRSLGFSIGGKKDK